MDPKDPYYITNGLDQAYTNNFDTITPDPFGVPTKSVLTIKHSLDQTSD